VKIQIVRRWAVAAADVALLCGLPVIASALPVKVPSLTASQLRGRILASAEESYAGYAESNATFGLPPLAGLTSLTNLLDGVTKMRVWQAAGGAVTSLSGAPLSLLQVTERTAGAIAFITVSMLGVAAIALFLSTITDSALGSALGALAALVISEVLVTLNAATVVQPYLPTRYWLAWIDFFRQPIFWRDIQRGFGIQAVYVVVFLAAAWANFSTKDITA